MANFDNFISVPFSLAIEKELGKDNKKIVERELFQNYGISLKKSILVFPNLHKILKKIIGSDVILFEEKCLKKICKIKKSKSNPGYNVTILDPNLIQEIIDSFFDQDSRNVLISLTKKHLTTNQILDECKLPKTSGYRKINNLIEKGILVEDGFIRSEQGRIIHKYRNLFEEISISISNETFSIKGHIGKKFIEKSSIFQFLDI